MTKKYLFVIILSISSCFANSQTEPGAASNIKLLSRPTKTGIKLRWAPTSALAWKYLNQYGYRLDRYTIMRDSQLVSDPNIRSLSGIPIKTWEKNRWEPLADTNDFAAIAAQALFGESFEITGGKEGELARLINMSKELDNRYAFALFAANQSAKIAEASGLFFNDTSAKPNEHYLYRIISLVPDTVEHIDSGYLYTGIADYEPLPKPIIFSVECIDNSAVIKWDKIHFETIYNNYIIERSDDNCKTFRSITSAPFTNIDNNLNNNLLYYTKTDSIPQTERRYYYRIKGVTVFGESSEPSDTMSVVSIASLKQRPAITGADLLVNGHILLRWSFPAEENQNIKGFKVLRGKQSTGLFKELSDIITDTRLLEFTDPNPFPINYYKIQAVAKNNSTTESFPYMVQPEDSIPPAIPVNLSGKIDSTGNVTIIWKANNETDLKGYLIFRANYAHEEFRQITSDVNMENIFRDSIALQTLTRKVYYKIKAIDTHYNQSDFSAMLELKRPDIIPPQPPIFNSYKIKDSEVIINWTKSSSSDVARHLLYRRFENEPSWTLIFQVAQPDTIAAFTDKITGKQRIVEYILVAVDSSKLESEPSKPLRIKVSGVTNREIVNTIYSSVLTNPNTIELKWEYNTEEVKRYQIYKSNKDNRFTLYRSVAGSEKTFNDTQVKMGVKYSYKIKAVFTDGNESPLSKAFDVQF